ncbi:oxidoreductase [Apiospora sp. TS-2023a]
MASVLIVGATRGLGASLTKQYASQPSTAVYATTRSGSGPQGFPDRVKWLPNIDLLKSDIGDSLAGQLKGQQLLDLVIITAGRFTTEDFSADKGPDWQEEVTMYTTSSIAPVFIVHRLAHANLLGKGTKVVLVSSESGSITLRHESEGGGNYAHHASKSALNMVGKLLSLDLKDKEVVISIVHPGFMRTEMTKGVGFDKYWDDGGGKPSLVANNSQDVFDCVVSRAYYWLTGFLCRCVAVTPDEAAKSLVEWAEKLDMSKSGEYWAPRGPGDIGTAEPVLGTGLSTPLKLPW